jgi:hypothetical protein
MSTTPKKLLVHATVIALIFSLTPERALAGVQGAAQLEGVVIGLDGKPADGYTMHLIDGDGEPVGQSTTGADGLYSFKNVDAGSYSLGVAVPGGREGAVAPVASGPIRLGDSHLERRDVKLMQAGGPMGANYSVGIWWAGLTTAAKVWTVIGGLVIIGITVAALDDDDDDDEDEPSPFSP